MVGSAQLREGAGLLQHGSILLAGRQDVVHAVTRGGSPPDLAGSLTEYTGTAIDPERVAEAVAAAAADRWDGEWMRADDCASLLTEACGLRAAVPVPRVDLEGLRPPSRSFPPPPVLHSLVSLPSFDPELP